MLRQLSVAVCLLVLLATGCGTTKQNQATEQMLNSDAVDAAVAKIDFTPMAGQKVYFDTKYMLNYKGVGFVNSEYVISSLRQQMAAAGLLLMENLEEADYVLEGRIGVLGTDSHELVYGIPSNSAIGSAASIAAQATTGAPAPATIPELSVARRNDQSAATKLGIFAYERVSREVIWQSGSSVARSTAKDMWFFGIGPFQKGSIYKNKLQFVGETQDSPIAGARPGMNGPIAAYAQERMFVSPATKPGPIVLDAETVMQASAVEESAPAVPPDCGGPTTVDPAFSGESQAGGGWASRPVPGRLPPIQSPKPVPQEFDDRAAGGEKSAGSDPFLKPY